MKRIRAWIEERIDKDDYYLSASIRNQLKTPTPQELLKAHQERSSLIKECLAKGAKLYRQNLAKIYTGRLSPGCATCAAGTWSCLYLNQRCTQKCFYCPQNRESARELVPADGNFQVQFDSPSDYAKYLKDLRFIGVGITGGEPFLAFKRLVQHVVKSRAALGPRGYIWAYTNGELVTEEKLKILAESGLDELRFDLSARDYDLSALKLALRWVRTVTVEMPAIPEDFNRIIHLLPQLSSLGVKHLNLHQLVYTWYNYKAFQNRGYSAVQHLSSPAFVLETELTALRVIRHALNEKIPLSINYCSGLYKNRFQGRASRIRPAGLALRRSLADPSMTAVTEAGYIRTLRILGTRRHIQRLSKTLSLSAGIPLAIVLEKSRAALIIPPSLLDSDILDQEIIVSYDSYRLRDHRLPGERTASSAKKGYSLEKGPSLTTIPLPSSVGRALFAWLFIKKKTLPQIRQLLIDKFSFQSGQDKLLDEKILRFCEMFRDREYLAMDWQEYIRLRSS